MVAWTETSSADTGSSAISTFGSSASARAMPTRWRWPPENCRGRWSRARSRQADQVASAPGCARAPCSAGRVCGTAAAPTASARPSSAGSASCRGPGRPSGSARCWARVRFAGSDARRRSGSRRRWAGSRPTMARASVDLPQPDSPTRPSVSPLRSTRSTPSTARFTTGFLPKSRSVTDTGGAKCRARPSTDEDLVSSRLVAVTDSPLPPRPSRSTAPRCRRAGRRSRVARAGRATAPAGSPWRQASSANGHRGAKEHPAMVVGQVRAADPDGQQPGDRRSGSGTERSSENVYGCRGAVTRSTRSPDSTTRPAYMTYSREQVWLTTARSWLTRRSPSSPPAAAGEHAEDLGLDRHVERGGRLVGEDQPRLGGQRDRDADPLAHAAGQLVRVQLGNGARVGDPDLRP